MIIHDVVQGTFDWMMLRLGIPTCSQFDRLLTPKARKPAEGRHTYRCELVAEWLMGQPLQWGENGWVERGAFMEEESRAYYEMTQGVDVQQVGFITTDDGMVGGSPDGLVGDDGGVEIKVLSAKHHMRYLLGLEFDYVGQCQGYMWLTGRPWWDFVAYNPTLPPMTMRIDRDPTYAPALEPVLKEFCTTLENDKHRFYASKKGGPDNDYEPLSDDELAQLHRELTTAEADDYITQEEAQRALAAVFEGRWREARRVRDLARRRVLEDFRPQLVQQPAPTTDEAQGRLL